MNSRHTNEDNAPHDAGDEALDTQLAGADDDLQDALRAALEVDAGLTAIVGTTPQPPDLSALGACTPLRYLSGFGPGGGFLTSGAGSGGARSGAGPQGLGGMGGGGGAGAGGGRMDRSRKEEDAEHERSTFLVESDPDQDPDDEPTAPPVIGG